MSSIPSIQNQRGLEISHWNVSQPRNKAIVAHTRPAKRRASYDFIVGDDWVVAVGVVAALALSAVLARSEIQAWWVMLVAVVLLLSISLWRATRTPQ
ncbi:MAG: hypothetical protein ABIV47_26645 [Roseiflexaceae bacterium]